MIGYFWKHFTGGLEVCIIKNGIKTSSFTRYVGQKLVFREKNFLSIEDLRISNRTLDDI